METVATPSSCEPPSDPEELRKLIESVSQPGSSQLHETLPPVPPNAPEFLRKNWRRYAMKRHKAPGLLKIVEWNYDHPVVWINALLAAILATVIISQSERLSLVPLGVGLVLLALLDYQICRWWLRKHPFKVDPITEWLGGCGIIR